MNHLFGYSPLKIMALKVPDNKILLILVSFLKFSQ